MLLKATLLLVHSLTSEWSHTGNKLQDEREYKIDSPNMPALILWNCKTVHKSISSRCYIFKFGIGGLGYSLDKIVKKCVLQLLKIKCLPGYSAYILTGIFTLTTRSCKYGNEVSNVTV